MANVTYNNGQFYATSPLGNLASLAGNNTFFSNPNLLDSYVKQGLIKPINAPTANSQQQTPPPQRAPFSPNASTQAQLQGLAAAPQWMMDAYSSKIGQMGGNANPAVPFNVTQSGFPTMPMQLPPQSQPQQQPPTVQPAGKSAPYASIIGNLGTAYSGAANAASKAV